MGFVRRAIELRPRKNESGHLAVKLGNVEFWKEGDDLIHSIPEADWNHDAISNDMSAALQPPCRFERAARAAGWDVRDTGAGWHYLNVVQAMPNSETSMIGQYHTAAAAWRGCCDQQGLLQETNPPLPGEDPHRDLYKAIAKAAGYWVRVWGTVEMDDSADSYWWQRKGAAPNTEQSTSTFALEADAWKNCCLANHLLQLFYELATTNNYAIERSEFGRWYWQRGKEKGGEFSTPEEASVDCCVINDLQVIPEEGLEECHAETGR